MLTFQANCLELFGQLLECTVRDGKRYIAVRALCEVFGLDAASQVRRLATECWADVAMLPSLTAGGHMRGSAHLEVGGVPTWLFTVQDSRVSPESQEKITHFRRECLKALSQSPKVRSAAEDLLGMTLPPRPFA